MPPVVFQPHVAGCRQPAKLHRKQKDQHDAKPEIRRGKTPQCKNIGGIIPDRVLFHGRNDARRNADGQRNDDRHRSELHRHRQFFEDQLEHGLLDPHRLAEISGKNAFDPIDVLQRQRLIEPILLADLLDDLRVPLLARHDQMPGRPATIAAARRSAPTRKTVSE